MSVELEPLRVKLEADASAFAPAMREAVASVSAVERATGQMTATVAPAMARVDAAAKLLAQDWSGLAGQWTSTAPQQAAAAATTQCAKALEDLDAATGKAASGVGKVGAATDDAAKRTKRMNDLVKEAMGRDPPGDLYRGVASLGKVFGTTGNAVAEMGKEIVYTLAQGSVAGLALAAVGTVVTLIAEGFKKAGEESKKAGEAMAEAARKASEELGKEREKLAEVLRDIAALNLARAHPGMSVSEAKAQLSTGALESRLGAERSGVSESVAAFERLAKVIEGRTGGTLIKGAGGGVALTGGFAPAGERDEIAALVASASAAAKAAKQHAEAVRLLEVQLLTATEEERKLYTEKQKAVEDEARETRKKALERMAQPHADADAHVREWARRQAQQDKTDITTMIGAVDDYMGAVAETVTANVKQFEENARKIEALPRLVGGKGLERGEPGAYIYGGEGVEQMGRDWLGSVDAEVKAAGDELAADAGRMFAAIDVEIGLFGSTVESGVAAMGRTLAGALNKASAGMGSVVNDIANIAKSKNKWEAISGIVNLILDLFMKSKAGATVMAAVTETLTDLVNTIGTLLQGIAPAFQAVAGLSRLFTDGLGAIIDEVRGALGPFMALIDPVQALGYIIKAISGAIGYAMYGIIKAVEWVVNGIGGWFGKHNDDLGRWAEKTKAYADSQFENFWDNTDAVAANTDANRRAAGAIDKVAESLTNVPEGFRVALARYNATRPMGTEALPHFAAGGTVYGPTLAVVGENGPEDIVPRGRGGKGGGLRSSIYIGTINMSAPDARGFVGDLEAMETREAMALSGAGVRGAPAFAGA